jgi:uncharacterized membrane protein YfcA
MSDGATPVQLPAWPRNGAFVAIVGVALCMIGAVVGKFIGAPSFHLALGLMFLSFAGLKYCVAMESVHRLQAVRAGRPDPRDSEKPQTSWPLVVYKFAACAMSLFAGIFVLTIGAEKVDRIFGG